MNLKTVKLASARYLDELPTEGSEKGHAFRDLEMEAEIHKLTQSLGVGRAVSAASISVMTCASSVCPAMARRCRSGSAFLFGGPSGARQDHQDGIFIEQLETEPAKYMPEIDEAKLSEHVIKIDLNRPMKDVLAELTKHHRSRRNCRSPARSSWRARSGACQDPLDPRSRRRDAAIYEGPPGLLRRPCEDPGRHAPLAPSARRRQAAWTAMSTSSSPSAARW